MKNNQFRAYLDKYIKSYREEVYIMTLAIDKDSNTRVVYLYDDVTEVCLGSIILYFTNEFVNISYSKSNKKVCKLSNQQDSKQFDYCELNSAKDFISDAIIYFKNSKLKGE